ncbi:endonuclease domain-containing protein [Paenarthrobacter sp. YJN-5]|uniref:endonuclease domain-containing protein n=1 Tax=Paenarthrobacter sp. YJN-5 TaxID=2735316 RepID=UPI001877BCFE|nr:hypothetical protein [Paenarthrobacter sp. YJN-5]QOT19427.1 hypothetical protein HMI59_22515 [Paenarthrobacter sp. YJN-5]
MAVDRVHSGGPRRRTTSEFVALAVAKHGKGTYDYSQADYVTAHVKVMIVCQRHGPFTQSPNVHLRGAGCPACGYVQRSRSQVFDREWFVAEASKVHGDLYDYSRTTYLGRFSGLTIECRRHGPFNQLASNHLQGSGCPACWQARRSDARQVSMEDFLSRAHATHGEGRYDYSAVVLGRMAAPVIILCPNHGPFRQRPHKHLMGDGCPVCAESRGEREVRKVLTAMGIDFASQWRHPALRFHRPLQIDFAIPERKIAIEFDGEQHQRPVRFRGITQERAERQFEMIKKRDAAKDAWAEEMGWTLIRLKNVESVGDDLAVALG